MSAVEEVAKDIRDSILDGVVREGDLLPRLDELMVRYDTSKLTAREALRILEIEGFVSVQRGNIGGAVAHFPTEGHAAYALSLVFESQGLTVAELAESIGHLEPLCVELCVGSEQATEAVLPRLAEAQQEMATAIDSGELIAATHAAQRWHRGLIEHCGNRAISVALGALEEIWWTHSAWVGAEESAHGVDISEVMLRRVHEEHAAIGELIAAGDAEGAAEALRAHSRRTMPGAAVVVYRGTDDDEPLVSADEIREMLGDRDRAKTKASRP